MPRDTEERQVVRKEAIQTAARAAAEAPWECVQACAKLVEAALALAGRSNVNAASDVLVAALLAEAAARGAAENVLINLPSVGDEEYAQTMRYQVDSGLHEIADAAARAKRASSSGSARRSVNCALRNFASFRSRARGVSTRRVRLRPPRRNRVSSPGARSPQRSAQASAGISRRSRSGTATRQPSRSSWSAPTRPRPCICSRSCGRARRWACWAASWRSART